MGVGKQQWRISILLFLQTINSLITPCVRVHRNSPIIDRRLFSKDPTSFPLRQPTSTKTRRQRCLFTRDLMSSQSTTSLRVMIPRQKKERTNSLKETLSSTLYFFMQATTIMFWSRIRSSVQSIGKNWWCFPMVLALIPPYCVIFKGSYASMPNWWSVVKFDHIASPDNASWTVATFLGSNVAYALSGTYLIKRFRLLKTSQNDGHQFRQTKFSMLGVLVLVAGLISTVFHSVQVLGPYALAENLCYLDHAVAGSTVLYFVDTCGIPSKMTTFIGILALITLVITTPNYTCLHSFWHYLSAATAILWALDGFSKSSDSDS